MSDTEPKTEGHTPPGPWKYDPHENMIIDAKGRYIGTVGSSEVWTEARNQNGYLFAAAPDLLAACESFVVKCETGLAHSTRSYAQMKAAIARVKGQP